MGRNVSTPQVALNESKWKIKIHKVDHNKVRGKASDDVDKDDDLSAKHWNMHESK